MTLFGILSLYSEDYSGNNGYFFDSVYVPPFLKDLKKLEKSGLVTINEDNKRFYLTETGKLFKDMNKL